LTVSKKKELVNRKEGIPKTWLMESLNLSKNAIYYTHDQKKQVQEDGVIRRSRYKKTGLLERRSPASRLSSHTMDTKESLSSSKGTE